MEELEILLMRHGKAKRYNVLTNEDLGLSESGWEGVEKTAVFIQENSSIEIIYSSPIRRAKETAEEIGRALGVPIVFDERLSEYSYGDCEGLTYREICEKFGLDEEEGEFFAKEALGMHSFTSYERYDSVLRRVCSLISEILKRREKALLVTHGEIIRTLICEAEGRKEMLVERDKLGVCNAELFSFLFSNHGGKCTALSYKRIYCPERNL